MKEYYIEKNTAFASIDFTAEEVNSFFQKVYQEFKPNFTVPGFRKGKIPYELFKQYVEPRKFYEEITYQLVANGSELLFREKKEEDFIQFPMMENTDLPVENQAYILKLKSDLYPKIELPDLTNTTIPAVIDKTVESIKEEKIDALLNTNATYTEAEGTPKNGQYLLLDYQFANEQDKIDPKEMKPAMIEIGKNLLYPDTDERILSVPIGETQTLTLSENENEPLFLCVKPVALKSKELPKFDQEFLDNIHSEKTMETFLKENEESAIKEFEVYEKNIKIDAFFEYMIKTLPMNDIPQILIDEHIDEELIELEENLKKAKLNFDEFLAKTGKTEEELRKDYQPKAEFLAKVHLIFRAMAKKYPEISPNRDVIEKEKADYLGKYKKEEINERELERFLVNNGIKKNAIQYILNQANFSNTK